MHQAFLGQQVMRLDRTYLSEHHLYGSSRLGLQKYLPSALSFEGLTLTPGVPVFQSLLQARPWYSRYGEDLFSPATVSTTLKKATISSDGLGVQSHLLGLRHYELANHLGNVQATVLDRVTPVSVDANGRPTREENSLVGYRADISSAQDYYPFGMLMPGRYTSDTSRKCVQVSQVVMVQKPWDIVIKPSKIPAPGNGGSGGSGGGKKKVVAHRYGADTTVPGVGSLPVADSFSDASLYVYHYVPAEAKTSGWVVAEKAQALGGLDYQLDLGEEPEVSVFLPLRLDTSVEVQNVRFELAGLRSNEIVAEVRARQYGVGSDSEEYQSLTDWRRLDNGEMSLGVPVNKTAVAGGGRTVVEWRFRAVSGAIVGGNIINMKAIITKAVVWVAENRVVWTCEEKDNYRYGFNGKEKDNEVKGLGNFQDYGMRVYDTRTARFPSVDPLAMHYPELTTYQFASNTPIQAIDLDGKEAFFVHGTLSGPDTWKPKLTNFITQNLTRNTHMDASFSWENRNQLTNNEFDRKMAAYELVNHVMNYRSANKITDEQITLIGHSHGGNVSIQAANYFKAIYGVAVNIININTPAFNGGTDVENPYNSYGINCLTHFYTKGDAVAGQISPGSDDKYSPYGNGIQLKNILLKSPLRKGPLDSHSVDNVNTEELATHKSEVNSEPSPSWQRNPNGSYNISK